MYSLCSLASSFRIASTASLAVLPSATEVLTAETTELIELTIVVVAVVRAWMRSPKDGVGTVAARALVWAGAAELMGWDNAIPGKGLLAKDGSWELDELEEVGGGVPDELEVEGWLRLLILAEGGRDRDAGTEIGGRGGVTGIERALLAAEIG
eukprot:gb/GEZN01010167.1/.p4 GENE.gb/GEZN01010167.1/~~gb/GEZN01010167.1/.p4  ORF type:complete len:153 (+),score=23.84 gb/GEZN01010167.1/:645-1103(+)